MVSIFVGYDIQPFFNYASIADAIIGFQIQRQVGHIRVGQQGTFSLPTKIPGDVNPFGKLIPLDCSGQEGVLPENLDDICNRLLGLSPVGHLQGFSESLLR